MIITQNFKKRYELSCRVSEVKNRGSTIESNVIFLCLGLPPASAAACELYRE